MTTAVSTEIRDLLALHLTPKLGPRRTAALLERFGSPTAILRADAAQLATVPHIGEKLAQDIRRSVRQIDVDSELKLVGQHGVHLRALGTPYYPACVASIPDPPQVLYVCGTLEARDTNAVGLVGSRRCTAYGKRVAERLAAGLVRAGFTVVSGLARGIDGAAHRAALEAGGRTLAVLAGGLARIYPPEHAELARDVAAAGALLSEAPMGQEPLAEMFPARNRLISGLCRGIVVVEAAERSGALITARHAAEQGREVFAVPGPVDSAASAGVLRLLRDGARLVRSAEDIVEDLDGVAPLVPPAPTAPPDGLTPVQQRIWDALADGARHIDEITRQIEMPVGEVSQLLMILEIKKLVRRLPGNQFERR